MAEKMCVEPSLRESSTLSLNEALVLAYLRDRGGDEYAFNFATIMADLRFDRRTVRAACRSLAAKGLCRFWRGLMNDDGELMGSGYGCTLAGLNVSGLPDWDAVTALRLSIGSPDPTPKDKTDAR